MDLFFWQYDLPIGFELDCVRYTVDSSDVALHWHNYYQLALCIEGEGTFFFTGKSYPYKEGDVFIVDNTEQHGAFAKKNTSAKFIFIMFYPQFVARSSQDEFDFEYLMPFSYNPNEFNHKIEGTTEFGCKIREMMLDIENENLIRRLGYRHIINAKLRLVLAELIGHLCLGKSAQTVINRHMKLRPAILFMEQHCHEPITLEEVAKTVYLSPSRFRHLFQETMHVGFKEYLIGLRYNKAKRMLVLNDNPIAEIASLCGFSNLYSFYKLFKQREKKTPAEFRKHFGKNNSRF